MKSQQSRLMVVGATALAISLTAGLVASNVADAKKKKKSKSGTVTVSKTTPTPVPKRASLTSLQPLVSVPLTVGKKAKGKVVGWDSLTVTTMFTGTDSLALQDLDTEITAPNGRTVELEAPIWNFAATTPPPNTTSGPLTESPDSPVKACFPSTAVQACPGGSFFDPEATLAPPYAGTVRDEDLSLFSGVPARGTWTVKVTNLNTNSTGTLNSVSITMTLRKAPA